MFDYQNSHGGPVWQIAWAHPKFGSILASCGFDRKVIIWKEIKHGEWHEVQSHSEHQGSVNSVAFAPWECGLRLAAASSDGTISLLTRKADDTWEPIVKLDAHDMGVNSISWAPLLNYEDIMDSSQADKGKYQLRLVSGSCDFKVKVWEYKQTERKFELLATLSRHTDWVRDVAWCPSIGSPFDTIASCGEDGQVVLWTNQPDDRSNWTATPLGAFGGPVWRVSWSISGTMLAVSCASKESDNTVHVYRENEQGAWEEISSVSDDNTTQQLPKIHVCFPLRGLSVPPSLSPSLLNEQIYNIYD
eukprot:TRINITY_DN4591_c0_g1_i6.p1 TRINITY_DN4591_c0_g1~~TRINITY_DN4591_c0_g1_i6.p1  ORF type:complete len:303 (+),score=29.09 TRINITY_DN4591_c0_g1_i6:301-1209(+)